MSTSRGEVMNSIERVFARICLEYGWATRSQLTEVVRARSQAPNGSAPSLSALLIVRGVLTLDQTRTLEKQVSEVTRTGAYADVRKTDTVLGQVLVETGSATSEQISAALALQKETADRNAPVPRLSEILIDQGVLTFAEFQEALQQRNRPTQSDLPQTETARTSAAPASEPEEVARAAEDPKNVLGKYVLATQIGK